MQVGQRLKLRVANRKRLAEAEVVNILDVTPEGSPYARYEVRLRFVAPRAQFSFHDDYGKGNGEFRTLRYEALLAAEVFEV